MNSTLFRFTALLTAFLSFALAQPLQARRADAFVDSIGVNVHLHYYDTTYADFERNVLPSLRKLGIRHIRDGICPSSDITKQKRLQTLFTELSVLATLIVDPRCESVAEAFTYVNEVLGTDLLAALEGPNEYDLSGLSDWQTTLLAYQENLYSTFKGDPATAPLTIIGPSVTSESAADDLGDISEHADVVNLHSYYSFRSPETSGWGDNGYGSVIWQLQELARPLNPNDSLPIITTETGYHTVLAEEGIPETVASIYLPRLLLNNFNQGISRTFIYELLDEWDDPNNREANFGLVRSDGTKKPAFTTISNLINLLEDPCQAPCQTFTPGLLEVGIEPATAPLSWTLLQKRSGIFYLALWDNKAIFNAEAESPEVVNFQHRITLDFDKAIESVSQALPNESMDWKPLIFESDRLTLEVGSKVLLLRLKFE